MFLWCFFINNEDIDIDRLGNTVPIIDKLNNKRKNNHIANYDSIEKQLDIQNSESVRRLNLIPTNEQYDYILIHLLNYLICGEQRQYEANMFWSGIEII